MANPEIANNNTGNVILSEARSRDETFTAAGGADIVEGTILARLTASGKIQVYVQGGAGGLEIPIGVLTYTIPDPGAGDIPIRMMVSGEVRKERLVIDVAGGGGTVGNVEIDGLRDFGITALDVDELNIPDNQ